jgi:hypothetical protein
MAVRRIVGLALVVIGVVALLWGGVFWTNRDTVLDAGPIKVTTDKREGVRVPPILGGAALLAGVLLVVLPDRKRV